MWKSRLCYLLVLLCTSVFFICYNGYISLYVFVLSLLFPVGIQRVIPWGYYGLLSLARMDWDPETQFSQFFWRWPQAGDVALLLCWAALFFAVGRTLFVRKEV